MTPEEAEKKAIHFHITWICGILKRGGVPRASYTVIPMGKILDLRLKTSITMPTLRKLINYVDQVSANMYFPAIKSKQNFNEPVHLRFIFLDTKSKFKLKRKVTVRQKLKVKSEDPLMSMARLAAFDME